VIKGLSRGALKAAAIVPSQAIYVEIQKSLKFIVIVIIIIIINYYYYYYYYYYYFYYYIFCLNKWKLFLKIKSTSIQTGRTTGRRR
jgi:hypothetical protein